MLAAASLTLVLAAAPPAGRTVEADTDAGLRAALEARHALGHPITVGTSSPRRAAQLRCALGCDVLPIRGNVPRRLERIGDGCDAVCLAAAGLRRLGVDPPHAVPLPVERFPTAPAQGALAVQARIGDDAVAPVRSIDHAASRARVEAERAFLCAIDAGCHTPAAATATLRDGATIHLHAQLFTDDLRRFDHHAEGADPERLGTDAGRAALEWLEAQRSA